MPSKQTPFFGINYLWDYGEDNWNVGMDDNLQTLSYLGNKIVQDIVDTLPSNPSEGAAYILSVDKLIYQYNNSSWHPITPSEEMVVRNLSSGKYLKYSGGQWVEDYSDKYVVSVKQFGAKGDGTTDDYQAFADAITHLNSTTHGGCLLIPAGTYKLNNTWSIERSGVGSVWHNLTIKGEGTGISVLDFSSAPAGADGIAVVGPGGRMGISSLEVRNSKGVGINWNSTAVLGGAPWMSRVTMSDVVVDGSGSHGVRMRQLYMGQFDNVESRNSGGRGFSLEGFHTSLIFNRCWAGGDAAYPDGGNLLAGWYVNGCTYSQFNACAADWNGRAGWGFSNVAGVSVNNCGAESNSEEGYIVTTGTSATTGIPPVVQDVKGFSFNDCFAYNNSKAGVNSYANFLGVSTAGGRKADITSNGTVDTNEDGSSYSVVLNGTNGTVTYTENGNAIEGTTLKTGSVYHQNNSKAGRNILLTRSANQAVATDVDNVVGYDVVANNSIGATIFAGSVTIPSGVNRVRVSAGLYWDTNSTGIRLMYITKNNVGFAGGAQSKVVASTYTPQFVSTGVLEVSAGDVFRIHAHQTSGASLSILSNNSTYFLLEVVG